MAGRGRRRCHGAQERGGNDTNDDTDNNISNSMITVI